jgi:hypothetical protein
VRSTNLAPKGILVIPQWVAEMKELPYRETRMVR